jgi:hypothetical protein
VPKGEPLARTVRNDRWNKKAGYKTKGFSLRGDIADRFAEKCKAEGRSQASVIQELMLEYIEKK